MNKTYLRKTVLSALFLCMGIILPFFTMQIKEIGDSLLPMHLPVMLCGIICGWQYGAAVGLLTPLLRSLCFGMPPLYPNAVWMMCELFTYGLVIGLLYIRLPKKLPFLYLSLIISQLSGRIVWAAVKTLLLYGSQSHFTLSAFLAGGFIDALPGIILQLILIPTITKIVMQNSQ